MDATTRQPPSRTLVLGLGNAMLGDLGAGIELIHRLRRQRPRPPGMDLIRSGLVHVSLGRVIGAYTDLIVVESRPVGGAAGTVVELQGRRMDLFLRQQTGDAANLADVLELLAQEGTVPARRALMLLQPGSASVGFGLSRPVEAALPRLLERVLARTEEWRAPAHERPDAARAETRARPGCAPW